MATYTLDPTTGFYVLSADQSFSVSTDQPDYSPGQTVQITANFDPGSTVQLMVAHDIGAGADGIWGTADDVLSYDLTGTVLPWTVTAGATGAINASWFVNPDALGQSFELVAVQQAADGTFTGPVAMTSFTDSAVDLTTASGTVNNAVFINTAAGPAGTGNFSAFLGIQNNGTERGYNTDGAPTPLDDKSVPSVHTGSLLLNNVPLVYADGHAFDGSKSGPAYREFILDINQSGSLGSGASDITLNALQIYLADQSKGGALLATGPFTGTAAFGAGVPLVYNLGDNPVLLSDHASGSGKFDYKILIPDSDFAGGTDSSFVYLYSQFSGANAGFEEFGVSAPSGTTTTGSTPDAVVGIDKQISIDGGATWLDQGLFGTAFGSDTAPTVLVGSTINYQVLVTNNTTPNALDLDPKM